MFHLFTHAFFKALLFLGAGSVIHGLHNEQDMRKMGGTFQALPATYLLMIIGTLALTGVGIPGTPLGFAGFFSKDMIIEEAFMMGEEGVPFGMLAFWVGVIAAGLTSFYSWRLIFMTFHGKFRGEKEVLDHAHESPPVMMIPLILLAVGAIFAGITFKDQFVGRNAFTFWEESLPAGPYAEGNYGDEYRASLAEDVLAGHTDLESESLEAAVGEGDASAPSQTTDSPAGAAALDEVGEAHGGHHPPTWVLWTPLFVTVFGFALAWFLYVRHEGFGARLAARKGPLHSFLLNKWYFDELYHFVFVRGTAALGDIFWKVGDRRIIDGFGPNGFAASAMAAARRLSRAQSGFLYHYAFVMLIGVVALTLWAMTGAGGE